MSNVFAEYLLQQHELPIAGVGHLEWVSVPAVYGVVDREFTPPGGQWKFTPIEQVDGSLRLQRLTGFLAVWKNQTEEEAFEAVQNFGQRIQQQLQTEGNAPIGSFGYLQSDASGIRFESTAPASALTPLSAERVIREGASHQMLVGDQQTTTAEMEAYLAEDEPAAVDRWWIWPVVLGAIAVALIVWRRVMEGGL